MIPTKIWIHLRIIMPSERIMSPPPPKNILYDSISIKFWKINYSGFQGWGVGGSGDRSERLKGRRETLGILLFIILIEVMVLWVYIYRC